MEHTGGGKWLRTNQYGQKFCRKQLSISSARTPEIPCSVICVTFACMDMLHSGIHLDADADLILMAMLPACQVSTGECKTND